LNGEETEIEIEEKDLDELEKLALRPSVSPLQNLLATELATAVLSADVLQKIRHICEAFLMTGERELAGLTLEDVKRIEALSEAFIRKVALPGGFLMVPWPFTPTDAELYFLPFCGDWVFEGLPEIDYAKLRAGDPKERRRYFAAFCELTGRQPCHAGTVFMLQGFFTNWALPLCLKLMTALFEKYISSEVWERTVSSMRGRRTTYAGAGAEGFAD